MLLTQFTYQFRRLSHFQGDQTLLNVFFSVSGCQIDADLTVQFEKLAHDVKEKLQWKKITNDGLNLDYVVLLPKMLADTLFIQLQRTVEYYDGELTKVKVFGKWHQIPRQQAAYGNGGVEYRFSGITLPAKPWIPPLKATRDLIANLTGSNYNFVLVNRYRNGSDHIGEHRDNETELDKSAPIASLSLGQQRQFVLRHKDSRAKGPESKKIGNMKIDLEHGSLLMMNPPTNDNWYHSIPPRKTAPGVRVNLTFRKLII